MERAERTASSASVADVLSTGPPMVSMRCSAPMALAMGSAACKYSGGAVGFDCSRFNPLARDSLAERAFDTMSDISSSHGYVIIILR